MSSESNTAHDAGSATDHYTALPLEEGTATAVDLPARDLAYLQDEWEDAVDVTIQDGTPHLTISNQAGIIGLPSTRVLTITPKVETNLLYLLAYTGRVDERLIASATNAGYKVGDSLLILLGRLFLHELEHVLRRGLAQEYRETDATQNHLRGQLQLDRQFRRHGPVPLRFECRYQELTHDITLNRIVLASINALVRLLPASSVRNDLIRHRELFQEQVKEPRAPLTDLERISISHLTDHYRELLLLCKVILQEQFLGGLDHPEQPFPSLVFDMPGVFEEAVVDAVRAGIDTTTYRVTSNDLGVLAERIDGRGDDTRRLEPDVIIRRRTGQPPSQEPVVAVGDAKWKETMTPGRDDLYQIATYQAKCGQPGFLIYPGESATTAKRYRYPDDEDLSAERGELHVTGLNVAPRQSYDSYTKSLEESIQPTLRRVLNTA